METRVIKCITCDEVLGSIQKVQITDYDVEKYREMVSCSAGHTQANINLEPEEE